MILRRALLLAISLAWLAPDAGAALECAGESDGTTLHADRGECPKGHSEEGSPDEKTPSPSGRAYLVFIFGRACADCPVARQLDVWSFREDGRFTAFERLGTGTWEEHFSGKKVALWSVETFLGAGSGRFSGATFPAGGRSLFARGWYTFDLAVVRFFALGLSLPTGSPATGD